MIKINKDVKEELNIHIRAIQEIAQIHELPFFFTMAVADNEEKTEYRKELLTAQICRKKLANDLIRKHMLVEGGFEPIPPRESLTVNMEEIMNEE